MTLARLDDASTVAPVPTPDYLRLRSVPPHVRGLGSIVCDALAGETDAAVSAPVLRLPTAADTVTRRFPLDVQTRTLDDCNRFKPVLHAGKLADLLGWVPGGLAVVMVDGWLVLTQPGDVVDTPRSRNGHRARLHVSGQGVERISLAPAHVTQLALGLDRQVLITALPGDHPALVITAPAICARSAPAHVTSLMDTAR